MGTRRVVPAPLAALVLVAGCGDRPDVGYVRDAVRAVDEVGARPPWPGFDPRRVPLALFDGSHTYLLRHPSPPEGFRPLRGLDEGWVLEGRHPAIRANTAAELAGVPTAVVSLETGARPDSHRLAGLLVHEAFHVFQDWRHPEWTPDEVALFTYPVRDARLLRLRRLETEALRRALEAPDSARVACWSRTAVAFREDRFRRLPEEAAAYERGTELREGLARYVERRARDRREPPDLPPEGYRPEATRTRAYAVGHAWAHLLDRLAPGWKEGLEAGQATSLHGMLAKASAVRRAATTRCRPSPDERARALAVARADVERSERRDRRDRGRFEDRPGWRIRVEAGSAPLFPAAFDPQNVRVLDGGAVLHTRWLKLEAPWAQVEVLGTETLTEPAGSHPLFQGVRRLLVTGLREEPGTEVLGDTLRVTARGFEASFLAATADRAPQRTLRIEPVPTGEAESP